ncbi:MAG: hypothetical protein GY882_03900 [Actinomycetia bacterium]|nr:hypothetical protein [Actinomycetes bacterium]MCP4843673.1 hypothetical protein [Actinomycetes bacterium]
MGMDACCSCERTAPEVDLRYGDCCVDCLAFDCDRCDKTIPIDEELRLVGDDGNCTEIVCQACLTRSDRVDGEAAG